MEPGRTETRTAPPAENTLADHLAWWGLRRFRSDAAYGRWQEETLFRETIHELNRRARAKSASPDSPEAEIAFYDLAARSDILPVLYSQRYEYYLHVGREVLTRLAPARLVLDIGCGVGVLTTWYARQAQDVEFLGIDRSPASLAAARKHADLLGLQNVRFVCGEIEQTTWPNHADLVVSTQAIFQSEYDPGLPSRGWQTFVRDDPHPMQGAFEQRTGVGRRLDQCVQGLRQGGRMISFEKTWHLARRIPFQRALAARGFHLLESPVPIAYWTLGEATLDGPLYVVGRGENDGKASWSETPFVREEETFYRCVDGAARVNRKRLPDMVRCGGLQANASTLGRVEVEWGWAGGALAYGYVTTEKGFAGLVLGGHDTLELLQARLSAIGHAVREDVSRWSSLVREMWPSEAVQHDPHQAPLYESHTMTAQLIWETLPARRVKVSSTSREEDGRQFHVELGTSGGLAYLYWANTFDQRQLVVMDPSRASVLDAYYREATPRLSTDQV